MKCTVEIIIIILTFLVTVLISWNIYTLFDFKSNVTKLKAKIKELEETKERNLKLINNELSKAFRAVSNRYYVGATGIGENRDLYYFIMTSIFALERSFRANNIDECKKIITTCIYALNEAGKYSVKLSDDDKMSIITEVNSISCSNEIPLVNNFVRIVSLYST